MKKILILLFLLLGSIITAHPWKPSHYVIVDTDGGIDDLRTLSMLLASPDVRVLAVIASPGALTAGECYIKVKSLLNSFHHQGVPVGINRSPAFKSPQFKPAKEYAWGDERDLTPDSAPGYREVIEKLMAFEKTRFSFISLGGLSAVSEALREIKGFRSQIKDIIWSSDGLSDTRGFNYNIDRNSSEIVVKGDVQLTCVTGADEKIFYDDETRLGISSVKTAYAKKISDFLGSQTASVHPYSLQANDEMVALFIHFPQYFQITTNGSSREAVPSDLKQLKEAVKRILNGNTVARNQIIRDLPSDPGFYFEDIQPFVNEIREKYGEDEWASGVIASELHRHLGVFAIVGVKMGIRAREYFATGVDEFRVISRAGSDPPLSCLNDGVQVSTGATPGHGLLEVSSDTARSASCDFRYQGRTLRLTLKPEIAKRISDELREINFIYGLDSNTYWELVRKNSIKYWKDLDRHTIFRIEVVN